MDPHSQRYKTKEGAASKLSASHLQALVLHVIDVTVLFIALAIVVLRSLVLGLKKVLQISIHE